MKITEIILKALKTNALSTKEIQEYVFKKYPTDADPLIRKHEILQGIHRLKKKGELLRHRGRYQKAGKDVWKWYYNLIGQDADRMKKAENIKTNDPTKKEMADLYTKYHLNRLNLTPQLNKQWQTKSQ